MREKRSRRLLTCVAIATAGWVTAAAAADPQAVTVMPDPMEFGVVYEEIAFEAADTNGDNLISEGEFVRDAAAGFSGLDAQGDGRLTPAELGPHDAARFARVDADGDGRLSFDEVMANKTKAFRAADRDGDGLLTFGEIVDSVKAELAK